VRERRAQLLRRGVWVDAVTMIWMSSLLIQAGTVARSPGPQYG
jgi:hypothetical protein